MSNKPSQNAKPHYSLTVSTKSEMLENFSDGRILENLFQYLSEYHDILPVETELWDIVHTVLDNIDLDSWAKSYVSKI